MAAELKSGRYFAATTDPSAALGTGVGRHRRQPALEFSQFRNRNPLGKEVRLTMGAAVAEFQFGDKGADQAPFRPEPFNHLLDNRPSSVVLAVDHANDIECAIRSTKSRPCLKPLFNLEHPAIGRKADLLGAASGDREDACRSRVVGVVDGRLGTRARCSLWYCSIGVFLS